ncbi:MAG: hypothetical protein R3C20_10840 [Planctomycetaceae bacterium]
MELSRSKRTTRYISSAIQGKLMVRLSIYWIVYNSALLVVMAGQQLVRLAPDLVTGQSNFDLGRFSHEFFSSSRPLLISMSVFCPLIIWDMLRYSHRIAGPIYHFRRVIETYNDGGELRKVTLRGDDLLQEFQVTFNRLVDRVHQKSGTQVPEEVVDLAAESQLDAIHSLIEGSGIRAVEAPPVSN